MSVQLTLSPSRPVLLLLLILVLHSPWVISPSSGASIHPSSVVLSGTPACDAQNRDPCSTFPGLCSTGGGLCVLKGPCEYECVCPPDGRRGRDCTGSEDVINPSGEEVRESSNGGSLLNSLLVFPQDLFWDLNHVLRPEESVKIMLSTPPQYLDSGLQPTTTSYPPSNSTNATKNVFERMNITPTTESSMTYNVNSTIAVSDKSMNTSTTLRNSTQSPSSGSEAKLNPSVASIQGISSPLPPIKSSTSSPLPSSSIAAILTTPTAPSVKVTTHLPTSTLSLSQITSSVTSQMTLKTLPTNDDQDKPDELFTDTDDTIASRTTALSDNQEDQENRSKSRSSAIRDDVQPLPKISARAPNVPSTARPTTTRTVFMASSTPAIATSSNSFQTTSQPRRTNEAVSKMELHAATSPKPMVSTTSIPVSENMTNLTNTIANDTTTNNNSNNNSSTIDTTSKINLIADILGTTANPIPFTSNHNNFRELFPGHESFPTFFSDVIEDKANGDDVRPNVEMSKRVHRVFFPIPQFEKVERRRGEGGR